MSLHSGWKRIPITGWIGLAAMALTEIALLAHVALAATWFTPIMWSGLILFLDGLLKISIGRSWLSERRREFPILLLLSILVWLLFEGYNLHLHNWIYLGLPANALVRDFGYLWSFATIMPGVFLMSELVDEALRRIWGWEPRRRFNLGPNWLWFWSGLALVTIPLVVQGNLAGYMFGPVWMGFVFLVDSLNSALGLASVRVSLRRGASRSVVSVLVAGLLCGLVWETWNYQAFIFEGAHWVYTFPEPLRFTGLQFGQMPLIGLAGFPPFALELLVFYRLLHRLSGGERVLGRFPAHWLGNS